MNFITAKKEENILQQIEKNGGHRPIPDKETLLEYQKEIEYSTGYTFPLKIILSGFLYAYNKGNYNFYDIKTNKFNTFSTNAREEVLDGISHVLTGFRYPMGGDSSEYLSFHRKLMIKGLCGYLKL